MEDVHYTANASKQNVELSRDINPDNFMDIQIPAKDNEFNASSTGEIAGDPYISLKNSQSADEEIYSATIGFSELNRTKCTTLSADKNDACQSIDTLIYNSFKYRRDLNDSQRIRQHGFERMGRDRLNSQIEDVECMIAKEQSYIDGRGRWANNLRTQNPMFKMQIVPQAYIRDEAKVVRECESAFLGASYIDKSRKNVFQEFSEKIKPPELSLFCINDKEEALSDISYVSNSLSGANTGINQAIKEPRNCLFHKTEHSQFKQRRPTVNSCFLKSAKKKALSESGKSYIKCLASRNSKKYHKEQLNTEPSKSCSDTMNAESNISNNYLFKNGIKAKGKEEFPKKSKEKLRKNSKVDAKNNAGLGEGALSLYKEDIKTIEEQFGDYPTSPGDQPGMFRCFDELHLDDSTNMWTKEDRDCIDIDAKNGHLTKLIQWTKTNSDSEKCQRENDLECSEQKCQMKPKPNRKNGDDTSITMEIIGKDNHPDVRDSSDTKWAYTGDENESKKKRMRRSCGEKTGGKKMDLVNGVRDGKDTQQCHTDVHDSKGDTYQSNLTIENVRHATDPNYRHTKEWYIFNRINEWMKKDITIPISKINKECPSVYSVEGGDYSLGIAPHSCRSKSLDCHTTRANRKRKKHNGIRENLDIAIPDYKEYKRLSKEMLRDSSKNLSAEAIKIIKFKMEREKRKAAEENIEGDNLLKKDAQIKKRVKNSATMMTELSPGAIKTNKKEKKSRKNAHGRGEINESGDRAMSEKEMKRIVKNMVREASRKQSKELNKAVKEKELEMKEKQNNKRKKKKRKSRTMDVQRYIEQPKVIDLDQDYFQPLPLYGKSSILSNSDSCGDSKQDRYFEKVKYLTQHSEIPNEDQPPSSPESWIKGYYAYKLGQLTYIGSMPGVKVNMQATKKCEQNIPKDADGKENAVDALITREMYNKPSVAKHEKEKCVGISNSVNATDFTCCSSPPLADRDSVVSIFPGEEKKKKKKRKMKKIILMKRNTSTKKKAAEMSPVSPNSKNIKNEVKTNGNKHMNTNKKTSKVSPLYRANHPYDGRPKTPKKKPLIQLTSMRVSEINSKKDNIKLKPMSNHTIREKDHPRTQSHKKMHFAPTKFRKSINQSHNHHRYPGVDNSLKLIPSISVTEPASNDIGADSISIGYQPEEEDFSGSFTLPANFANLFRTLDEVQQQLAKHAFQLRKQNEECDYYIRKKCLKARESDTFIDTKATNMFEKKGHNIFGPELYNGKVAKMEGTDNTYPVSKSRQHIMDILASKFEKRKDCSAKERGDNKGNSKIRIFKKSDSQDMAPMKSDKKREEMETMERCNPYQGYSRKRNTRNPYHRQNPECENEPAKRSSPRKTCLSKICSDVELSSCPSELNKGTPDCGKNSKCQTYNESDSLMPKPGKGLSTDRKSSRQQCSVDIIDNMKSKIVTPPKNDDEWGHLYDVKQQIVTDEGNQPISFSNKIAKCPKNADMSCPCVSSLDKQGQISHLVKINTTKTNHSHSSKHRKPPNEDGTGNDIETTNTIRKADCQNSEAKKQNDFCEWLPDTEIPEAIEEVSLGLFQYFHPDCPLLSATNCSTSLARSGGAMQTLTGGYMLSDECQNMHNSFSSNKMSGLLPATDSLPRGDDPKRCNLRKSDCRKYFSLFGGFDNFDDTSSEDALSYMRVKLSENSAGGVEVSNSLDCLHGRKEESGERYNVFPDLLIYDRGDDNAGDDNDYSVGEDEDDHFVQDDVDHASADNDGDRNMDDGRGNQKNTHCNSVENKLLLFDVVHQVNVFNDNENDCSGFSDNVEYSVDDDANNRLVHAAGNVDVTEGHADQQNVNKSIKVNDGERNEVVYGYDVGISCVKKHDGDDDGDGDDDDASILYEALSSDTGDDDGDCNAAANDDEDDDYADARMTSDVGSVLKL